MLCPSCAKLISVSAERCPHCGAARPGLWGFGPALSRLFGGRLDPVSLILPACIVLYLLSLLLDPRAILQFGGGLFGLLSPSGIAVRILGSTHPVDLLERRWWTLLTAIYLHGGILHIFFNMMWTRSLAPEVARAFGPARFFVIWTAAGAFGFLVSDLLPILGIGGAHASIGASGSIFGLMAALIVYGRRIGASLMTRQIWMWALMLGFLGFVMPGVDNAAHVGGFAGGWVAASLYRDSIGRPDGRGPTLLALLLLALTVLGFVLNVTQWLLSR
jgi:rhomboid protease GluP